MIRSRYRVALLRMLAAVAAATAVSCFALAALASDATADRRPNIVFLLADDQRFDSLGCMGNREIHTPNIDRLAAEGVLFRRHYDTTAICMASRASIMTGLYEYHHGCNFDRGSMGRETFMFSYPVLLRQEGYRVGFAGKFGFPVTSGPTSQSKESEDREPIDQFDWWGGWVGQGSYETKKDPHLSKYATQYPHVSRALGAAACDFIKDSAASGKPFCLSISFKAPHHPYTPDPLDLDLYRGVTFSKPGNWGREKGAHLPEQARRSRMYQSEFGEWSDDRQFQKSLALYYQLINGNDVAVGMIREQLARSGVADNTVVIYTSDNGWMCGDHGLGGKVFPYEGASRAPLIICDPRRRMAAGKTCDALTANVDMAPTILDFARVPVPRAMDGVSLVPLLDQPGQRVHDALLLMNAWPWSAEQLVMSVVMPEWKYIYWFYGDKTIEPVEELYDMQRDPLELHSEAAVPDQAQVLGRMREAYDRQLAQARASCIQANQYPAFLASADRTVPWRSKTWTAQPATRPAGADSQRRPRRGAAGGGE
jgi:arylsulfatase A-like enzyme